MVNKTRKLSSNKTKDNRMDQQATYHIPTPEPFNFSQPMEWPVWRKRFERFRSASGLAYKNSQEQVNTLIYLMGDRAEDIFLSFEMKADDKKDFDKVIDKFHNHFINKRNLVFERHRFNTRNQNEGEPIQEFITSLFSLAEHCEYGTLHDQLIRDRIVAGVRDKNLCEKLLLKSDLTLEQAISFARQSEEVKNHQDIIQNKLEVLKINSKTNVTDENKKLSRPKEVMTAQNFCPRCGGKAHLNSYNCPAWNTICSSCKGRNHFARVCRKRKSIHQIDSEMEEAFLGEINGDFEKNNLWKIPILINNSLIWFKIDTGADVSVIPYGKLSPDLFHRIKKSDRLLFGPGKINLNVEGMIEEEIKYKDKSVVEKFYIIRDLECPLLGRPAIKAFNLVRIINLVDSNVGHLDVYNEFPSVFTGLGNLVEEYTICLKENAKPFALSTPRRIALPLVNKVKIEIDRMLKLGVIIPVKEASEWCAPIVVVPKPSGDIRLCVDLTELNKSIIRERHPIPPVEYTLAQMNNAKVFSKLDANAGYWQIPLAEKSRILTTFITPFGRYCFKRLPFGISSAAEHFQRRIAHILSDLKGVIFHQDDILIFGRDQSTHDRVLREVLKRIADSGMTLNKEKCIFSVNRIIFLGHVIDKYGIHADPKKIEAIIKMKSPENVTELKRFLGMVNFLGKFIPKLSDLIHPLNELLSSKSHWSWQEQHESSFKLLKEVLTKTPVLAIYDPNKISIVSADASSYGLGSVLFQKDGNGTRRVVAYASRIMSDTEKRYSQIEKEALALTWACEKFKDYIIGKRIYLETDHKPLISIFMKKFLEEMTPRLQRFKIRMMRYSYEVVYIPGKELVIPDTLSRCPLEDSKDLNYELENELSAYVNLITDNLPATDKKIQEIIDAQREDMTCQRLIKNINEGWSKFEELAEDEKSYWKDRDNLSINNNLILKDNRILIPKLMRRDILNKLHEGHLGVSKCRERARASVWWPGISSQINQMIEKCNFCIKKVVNRREPLKSSQFPKRPWQNVAMDLFQLEGKSYLLISDYFSRFFELEKIANQKPETIINIAKATFARHGIPELVRSDNGPQFSCREFKNFANEYGFEHITSSPKYPQSNGFIENAVKIAKMRISSSEDPYKALLAYRSTPLKNGYSPAELCMGRKLRTSIPTIGKNLEQKLIDNTSLLVFENNYKSKQEEDFNKRYGTKTLEELKEGDKVWVSDLKKEGRIIRKCEEPRSYEIEVESGGRIRRNRYFLKKLFDDQNEENVLRRSPRLGGKM